MLDAPKGFTDEVNNIIFDNESKTKKKTIIKNNKEGVLNMLDFTLFDNVLKSGLSAYALTIKDH